MAGCLRMFVECVQGPSFFKSNNHVRMEETPVVGLDTENLGSEVVILKNGRRICGTGGAIGNAPLVQNKSYFEVKVQQSGIWCIGLGTKKCDFNKLDETLKQQDVILLKDDSNVYQNGAVVASGKQKIEEGDVIGVTYDHAEVEFYVNGEKFDCTVPAMKATTVYPILFVDDGAILDVQFSDFYHRIPDGFDKIMLEQTLL
uniref:SPRY domain-containing protein 7 n=1 Tax=Romanomermis culicivorax TaxID=13658 RepID=A0A915KSG6_ROMCU